MNEIVLEYAEELGFAIGFIAAGISSVLQVCDLVANKDLKQRFKQFYTNFKVRTDPDTGGKQTKRRFGVA